MKNLLQRLQSITRKEDGFTMAELIVVIVLTPILATLCLTPIISASNSTAEIANKVIGTNQGTEFDLAKKIGLAGERFIQKNSILPYAEQIPLSKQALLDAYPATLPNSTDVNPDALIIPDGVEWVVGGYTYGNGRPEVCSVVYSENIQSSHTRENPAVWNDTWDATAGHHMGCWIEQDGETVPNYDETPRATPVKNMDGSQTVWLK